MAEMQNEAFKDADMQCANQLSKDENVKSLNNMLGLVYTQLCTLNAARGLSQPLETNVEPKTNGQQLQENRYKLLRHLYRLMLNMGSKKNNKKYLMICYENFLEDTLKNMTDSASDVGEYAEFLSEMANNFINIIQNMDDVAELQPKINKINLKSELTGCVSNEKCSQSNYIFNWNMRHEQHVFASYSLKTMFEKYRYHRYQNLLYLYIPVSPMDTSQKALGVDGKLECEGNEDVWRNVCQLRDTILSLYDIIDSVIKDCEFQEIEGLDEMFMENMPNHLELILKFRFDVAENSDEVFEEYENLVLYQERLNVIVSLEAHTDYTEYFAPAPYRFKQIRNGITYVIEETPNNMKSVYNIDAFRNLFKLNKLDVEKFLNASDQLLLCDADDELFALKEEDLKDAQHGLLGELNSFLLLRYQNTLSDICLQQTLDMLSYFHCGIQQQLQRLARLGEIGQALLPCLQAELLVIHMANEQLQVERKDRFHMRCFVRRFHCLLSVCQALGPNPTLLESLYQQMGKGNKSIDALLHFWLLCATQPMLDKISNWLLHGELPDPESAAFFIVKRRADREHYWQSRYELIEEQLPLFLNNNAARLLLRTGKNQQYSNKFLGIELSLSVDAVELQQQLSAACAHCYQERDEQPLWELLWGLKQKSSQALLKQLQELSPTPLELFTKLYKYLLLEDEQFVIVLIEFLEPMLEQPAATYDDRKLNNRLQQLLDSNNAELYVDHSSNTGTLCCCRFLLRWKHSHHWEILLGDTVEQYATCFMALWKLQYANYVLAVRLRRQQWHFRQSKNEDNMKDVREVRVCFEQLIDKIGKFMNQVQKFVLEEVLDSAYKSLINACSTSNTLDELLQQHCEYLHRIECGILLTRTCQKSRDHLNNIYNIIMRIDAEQQKFVNICGCLNVGHQYCVEELRSSCLTTFNVLSDLDILFEVNHSSFMISLYFTRDKQLELLVKKFL